MFRDSEGDYSEVLTTGTEAPRARTVDELSALIANAKGKLTVSANSSSLIIALNNSLRFSVTQTANGVYEITDRGDVLLIAGVGIAALLLVVMISRH